MLLRLDLYMNQLISSRRRKRVFLWTAGCLLYYPELKSRRERDLVFSADHSSMATKKRWFSLKLCVDLYAGDTFTVLGRAHALPSRTLFAVSHHGRHNLQIILSNPPTPLGACVVSTFPPLGIIFDPYTHDNY